MMRKFVTLGMALMIVGCAPMTGDEPADTLTLPTIY